MTDQAMSPLRRRMIEDMTIRKFAPKTQHDYLQRVKNFAAYLGRSPDTASSEDVRHYQLHLTACQSAFKFDPVSASNFDPFERRVLTVALASSELAGVAETWRARVA